MLESKTFHFLSITLIAYKNLTVAIPIPIPNIMM